MLPIVIGCDNLGMNLKRAIIRDLVSQGIEVEDVGCDGSTDATTYPLIAQKVCERIIRSGFKKRGILICGTGIGMAIAANKFRGIRAGVCHDAYSTERSILSDDCNVLCLGERVISPGLAKENVNHWIKLEFQGGPSQEKLRDILEIESETMRSPGDA